jgi:hypothetical protein
MLTVEDGQGAADDWGRIVGPRVVLEPAGESVSGQCDLPGGGQAVPSGGHRWKRLTSSLTAVRDPAFQDAAARDIRRRLRIPASSARSVRAACVSAGDGDDEDTIDDVTRPHPAVPQIRRYTARRPWRSSVACVFDADAAEIQRSLTGNRQAWSSAECELMPD